MNKIKKSGTNQINFSKLATSKLAENRKQMEKNFFIEIEQILNKSEASESDDASNTSKFDQMSDEKRFWYLRELLMNQIKNLALKVHDIDQRARTNKFKQPELERKHEGLLNETRNLQAIKEKNKEEEKMLKEIIEKLPEIKGKRILTDEEEKQMREVLKALEKKSFNEINENIQRTKFRFSLRNQGRLAQ